MTLPSRSRSTCIVVYSIALVFASSVQTLAQKFDAPVRDPHTPGYGGAKDLPDGANAPADSDGNFVIGPTHNAAPEMSEHEGVPQGTVVEFTMSSADSKIYPGIARDKGTFGSADPADP